LVKLGSQLNQADSTAQAAAPSGVQFNSWFDAGSFPGGRYFSASSGVGATGTAPTAGGNQYGLTLSVSAAGGFASTCQLTVQATDVAGKAVADTGVEYISYADPTFSGFNPSVASATSGFPVPTRSNGVVASVSGSGLITAIGVGQAIIEVQVPFALNTIATQSESYGTVAQEFTYAQIVVQVIP
jgi:hypothetical protein